MTNSTSVFVSQSDNLFQFIYLFILIIEVYHFCQNEALTLDSCYINSVFSRQWQMLFLHKFSTQTLQCIYILHNCMKITNMLKIHGWIDFSLFLWLMKG